MIYYSTYESILGKIEILADEDYLIGLYFEKDNNLLYLEKENEVIKLTKKWLDIYFKKKIPDFIPPLKIEGSDFQKEVYKILLEIPYGQLVTYGELAKIIASTKGIKKMSAQAIGGALKRNEIAIIVPCHRVIGTNNKLVGYAYGLDKKIGLLKIEGYNIWN